MHVRHSSLLLSARPYLLCFSPGLYGRTLALPMAMLKEASDRLNVGDVSVVLPVSTARDEVGALTRSFAQTVKSVQDIALAAASVAEGDLTVSLKARSEEDALIGAFNLMIDNITNVTNEFKDAVRMVSQTRRRNYEFGQ